MPTISINRKDFELLLGKAFAARGTLTDDQLEAWLPLVKGEMKDQDHETGELRLELQDSNRPDLWSCEGIARQIRIKCQGKGAPYAFFKSRPKSTRRLYVSSGLEAVRPYVAACAAVGYRVTEPGLAQLIQTQEKLAEIYGRKRRSVSIGLYQLAQIVFPVAYSLVKPDDARFTPLGFDEKMTLREILSVHPKGLEYGHLLAGHEGVPLLRDDEGQVLSLPPIINSRELGEVKAGDQELFVEVTGTDLFMVVLTLNILAVNLADRGASIQPVEVIYPSKTPLGKTMRTPLDLGQTRSIHIKTIESALGHSIGAKGICQALQAYGYQARSVGDTISAKPPAYRNDLMHAVDVVEDVAISQGYSSFAPVMPSQFTVGSLSKTEQVSDRIRDLMIGMGFQEIISNILASRQELSDRMRLHGTGWDTIVEVDNVMSQTFSCLRQWMTPSLLRVESASNRAFYPHRLFEVGEVAVPDSGDEHGTRTRTILGAFLSHPNAHFSEIHSCLDLLLYYLARTYTLEPLTHPSFLEGRVGRILANGQPCGLIGELHPEVLEAWQVAMPSVVFELSVDVLVE
ncbi:MAG: phenylalanine--tRNA ligase subunit beta [Nitrospiraceae bacterium]